VDDDEVIDAEIVDDNAVRPAPLAPDTILTPCHHGCTCGLHQQTVYGDRVPEHPPTVLDHGEMGLLVEAVGEATRLLNGYHDFFRKLRATATQTHGQASRALLELAVTLDGDALRRACAEHDRVEEAYADITPAERHPAPLWLKAMAVVAAIGMVVFDAYFFQQIFLNIMQVSLSDPFWKRGIGLVAALVLAIGVVATGRILAAPIWRTGRRWRRSASPDEPPPGRAARFMRVAAVGATPALTFFVLGWWASFRGQVAVVDQLNVINGTNNLAIPSVFAVAMLLLSLAVTVITLEILIYNPYQADLRRAERAREEARKQISVTSDAAAKAIDAHEIAWRDLRSARDEVIGFVQAELARPWQTIILPARLRHGRAGPTSAQTNYNVKIELTPADGDRGAVPGTGQVRITYSIFDGMAQPQPSPGPLAEVVRAVMDLDPDRLRDRQGQLEQTLRGRLGGPGPAADAADAEAPSAQEA
jgi:hypothetical protein